MSWQATKQRAIDSIIRSFRQPVAYTPKGGAPSNEGMK
jgi:hypothetical protein